MSDNPETEYYIRPEEIRQEIALKRYKDYDYFLIFGSGLAISFILFFFLRVDNPFIFLVFIICLFVAPTFGFITLVSGDTGKTYRNIGTILVTTTGIALRDYQGKVKHFMPFAKVTNIRYGYREHVVSVALDLGARVPIFVQFNLVDGKKFTIPMNVIIAADQKKIFAWLPVFK
jgi:hypothetical protein